MGLSLRLLLLAPALLGELAIKTQRVGTKDLVKFIHTSDWQLGMTRHFLSSEAQGEFSGDRINTIRKIGELAHQTEAEFIVVAGDVFETIFLPPKVIIQSLDAMGEARLPVFLLPGNHDPLSPGSIYTQDIFVENCPANVQVLDSCSPVRFNDQVEIIGAPWLSKHPDCDPLSGALAEINKIAPPDEAAIPKLARILVGHGMLETLNPDASSLSAIRLAPLHEALDNGLIHYVALGDRHIRWPEDNSGSIHYSGTHEATDYAEKTAGTALEVTINSKGEAEVVTHCVGQWRFKLAEFYLDGAEAIEELNQQLAEVERANRTILKLVLRGGISIAQKARLDKVLAVHADRFAALEFWDRHTDLRVLPDELEFDQLPNSGYVAKTAKFLTEAASNGDETASQALELLYLLISEGR